MIKPTVGRMVLYRPSSDEDGFARNPNGEPSAAVVVQVHNDRVVNLAVFDAMGTSHPRTHVPLLQPEDERPASGVGGYCEWMPYQKQVAAGEVAPTRHASS